MAVIKGQFKISVTNGTVNLRRLDTFYSICYTAGNVQEKTVNCSGFVLISGARITVKFVNTNQAPNPTLNVNGKGAKPVYYQGNYVAASALRENTLIDMVYTGNAFEILGSLLWSD